MEQALAVAIKEIIRAIITQGMTVGEALELLREIAKIVESESVKGGDKD